MTPTRRWARREYLDEILPLLWPAPARIQTDGATGGMRYVLLPSARRPKVMVPSRPRRAAAAVLRNYKSSAGAAQQARLVAMSLGARLGVADLLPARVSIDSTDCGPSGTIESYLSDALGREVIVSLYVGAPGRANRKPVLQLLTRSGETFAFAKIGMTALTRDLVADEGEALASLGEQQLTSVRVPPLLHRGQWHDYQVLVQAALPRASRAPVNPALLRAAMVEVAASHGTHTTSAQESTYWAEADRRLRALPPSAPAAALVAQWDALAPIGASSLTFGAWHGDWTPWNMTMSEDRALVWDWERFDPDVPVGFDALHYQLQSAIVRGGIAAPEATRRLMAEAATLLHPLGVPAAAASLVAALYLVEIGTRYLADGQAEAGAALGDLDLWLLPALRAHVEQISPRPTGIT